MGSFGGHALPGTMFFLWGLWISIQCLRLFHQRRLRGKRYYGHVAFSLACCCGTQRVFPWEGAMKVALPLVGMTVEGIGFLWQSLHMIQHFSMYAFFLLAGIVDLLVYSKAPLPKNIDYASHALAFIVEGLLFQFHTHGRSMLDKMLHTFLVYGCYACAVSMLVEMRFRNNVLCPLLRAFFIIFQGTWFWQVGYILYNPIGSPWDESVHDNTMLATIVAGWHLFFIFLTLIIFCGIINRCYSRKESLLPTNDSTSPAHGDNRFTLLNGNRREETSGLLKGESDDDSQL
jgi:hypothetical protein